MLFFFFGKAKSKLSNTTEPPWYSQCDFLLMETMRKLLWGLEEAQIYLLLKTAQLIWILIRNQFYLPTPSRFFPLVDLRGSWLVRFSLSWVRCYFLIVYHIICGKLSSLATLGPASSSRGWRTLSRLYFVLTAFKQSQIIKQIKAKEPRKLSAEYSYRYQLLFFSCCLGGDEVSFKEIFLISEE